jgi:antitoxin component YwqK of YwqJK toxin-antitoxin module
MLPKSHTLLLLAAFVLGLSACATAKKNAGTELISEDDWVNPVQEYDEGNGFRKVTLDINSDEKADVFNYYRVGEGAEEKLLVRKEIDLNFDGTVDVSQIWKEGEMTQEQIDADFDGRNDWIDFYDQGERIRAEWDTSFDGRPDLIRYYEGGKISRVEMDTTGDRQIDYWEYYEAGIMQRSGWDLNADGKVDKWGEK